MVRALFQGMTQQPLGIVPLVSRERERRKAAQRRHVTRIFLQDAAKNPLRGLPVVGHQGGRRFLDVRSLGISKPCALEGKARVRVLLQVDKRITVRKPCEMVMRDFFQHPPHFLARPRSAPAAPVGTRQIDARVCKVRDAGKQTFERRDALGDFVLLQQGCAQEPETIWLSGDLCFERAQPALSGSGTAGAQRRVRLAEALLEGGLWTWRGHGFTRPRKPATLQGGSPSFMN
jgi:hypothetical protein